MVMLFWGTFPRTKLPFWDFPNPQKKVVIYNLPIIHGLVLGNGGRNYMIPYTKQYIPYCQLGDDMLPITFYKKLKNLFFLKVV